MADNALGTEASAVDSRQPITTSTSLGLDAGAMLLGYRTWMPARLDTHGAVAATENVEPSAGSLGIRCLRSIMVKSEMSGLLEDIVLKHRRA